MSKKRNVELPAEVMAMMRGVAEWDRSELTERILDHLKQQVPTADVVGEIQAEYRDHPTPDEIDDPGGWGDHMPDVYAQYTQPRDPTRPVDEPPPVWEFIGDAEFIIDEHAHYRIGTFLRYALSHPPCQLVLAAPPRLAGQVQEILLREFRDWTGLAERSEFDEQLCTHRTADGVIIIAFHNLCRYARIDPEAE